MNLPFLPGHRFSDPYKQHFHKNQVFQLKTQTCTGKTLFNPNRKAEFLWKHRSFHNIRTLDFNLQLQLRKDEEPRD